MILKLIKKKVSRHGLGINALQVIYILAKVHFIFTLLQKRLISRDLKDKINRPKNINVIAFITSLQHFNPEDQSLEKYSNSGIAQVLRRVYQSLTLLYPEAVIHAVDKDCPTLPIATPDLIVGLCETNIFLNFRQNTNGTKPYVVPILVNSSSLYRLSQYKKSLKRFRQLSSISACELNNTPFRQISVLSKSDFALLVGNAFTERTFKSLSPLIESRIYSFNIWPSPIFASDLSFKKSNQRFVFTASNAGVRKGIFQTLSAWALFSKEFPDCTLTIMGGFDEHYADTIRKLSNDAVIFAGWVSTEEQIDILKSSQYVICPSIEEGQVCAVLEAMKLGCIPIISPNCGIDLSHLNQYIVNNPLDSDSLYKILVSTQLSSQSDIDKASSQTFEIISSNHSELEASCDPITNILRTQLSRSDLED